MVTVCFNPLCLDEDQLRLEELNDIMSTQSQRRMSTSAIPTIPEDLPGLDGEETAFQPPQDNVIYRQRRHQSPMRPFSCQVETVFADEEGTVLLDLSRRRQKHASADCESEEVDGTMSLVRMRRRSRSAGPSPTASVNSLGKTVEL